MNSEYSRPLFEVLIEEYNAQHPGEGHEYKGAEASLRVYQQLDPSDEESRSRINADEVKKFYQWLHDRKVQRSAMCYSGGGIRSATFGLGVLQGFAVQGLLTEFDYLSTVSGGGYLGSWLSAWIHRQGLKKVQERLANDIPASPLAPEPDPIVHLRSYSNYMSPKLGLLSADTWTLAAIFIRNLILNWLVLLPPILLLLIIPRLSFIVIALDLRGTVWPPLALVAAIALGVFSIDYIYANRPSLADANLRAAPADSVFPNEWKTQPGFVLLCLLPIALMAVSVTTFYAWARGAPDTPWLWLRFAAFGITLNLGGLIGSFKWRKNFEDSRLKWEILVAASCGGLGGLLTWLIAANLFRDPLESITSMALYICVAAPAFLGLFLLAATIFVGATSRFTTDPDREWFARAGAWMLLVSVVWVVVSAIVIFGPVLLVYSTSAVIASLSVGSVSGAVTLLLGHSSKTQAQANGSRKTDILLAVAAPLFAAFILICLSFGTSWLVVALFGAGPLSDLTTFQGLLEVLYHTSFSAIAAIAVAFLAIGLTASAFINANKFSLHAAYRDRLIRAYLGASRLEAERKPNPFTGLDENDNLEMHELRTQLFHDENVSMEKLAALLQAAPDNAAAELKMRLTKKSLEKLADWKAGEPVADALKYSILDDLNRTSVRSNRESLQQQHKDIFKPSPALRPLHIINITLNLVGGKKLAWQERRAESFTISPLHSGAYCVGYRDSRVYALNKNNGQAITLGTAMAISGAAVSPNMGYYSSSFVTFLLALFNLRLGWWLGNPGPAGDGKLLGKRRISTYDTPGPNFAARPIIEETLGLTDDQHPYVYLSDGGHFENLGMYEMVLRRCKMIVVSDGSADPDFGFEGLGNAISKIRVDLGVPIDIKRIFMLPRNLRHESKRGYGETNTKLDQKYCAIGTIRYSCVDKQDPRQKDEGYDGQLIYIKAFLSGTEPVDVYNYAKTHPSFPHESTANQMYSESQFESYRELGLHLMKMLCGGMQSPPPHSLKDFFDFVRGTF